MTPRWNLPYYVMGIAFLVLAKLKNSIRGYVTPKPFDISQTDRCVRYDLDVVDQWITHLEAYGVDRRQLHGTNVLELGPGTDLGIGLYLLAIGCRQYSACDVNDLMSATPRAFYESMFRAIDDRLGQGVSDPLRREVEESQAGRGSRLRYEVQREFSLVSTFGERSIDFVFSQAAFEHFEDVRSTISQLSDVCKPGAVLVVNIDLQTHSRWIRDTDPNNIYRYPEWLYRIFWFRGSPNRVRPITYKELFERSGWRGVSITPIVRMPDPLGSYRGVHAAFADPRNQMDYLSIMLCATRSEE